MTVSILIVNWNSRELLRNCLLSIRATCADQSLQIVVVDGGSFDGCAEMLAAEFPEVDFIQSKDNVGFGRANNLGLLRVTGEVVWVLNPDTEVRPGALQTLLSELRRLADAGIVSPRFLNSEGDPQSGVHALPRPIRQALDSEFLRRLLWPLGLWAPRSGFAPSETMAVEAIAGTGMLMWTKTFRAVGGFNPVYFMYAEDMDLCLKIQRAGLRVYHVPAAVVIHHGGASSAVQGNSFSAVMMCDSLHSYMLVNRGRLSALIYRIAAGIVALSKLIVRTPGFLLSGRDRRPQRKAALLRFWSVLSWSCGGQKWTRRFATPTETASKAA